MPLCKRCGDSFPNRVTIDGRERVISNRKFCLKCSPFGEHNTRDITKAATKQRRIISCPKCGKEHTSKGRVCQSCYLRIRHHRLKERAIQYKGGSCQACGYSKCPSALCFHHLDEAQKSFSVGGGYSRSWSALSKELDKCILLCSNCHSEVHAGILQLPEL